MSITRRRFLSRVPSLPLTAVATVATAKASAPDVLKVRAAPIFYCAECGDQLYTDWAYPGHDQVIVKCIQNPDCPMRDVRLRVTLYEVQVTKEKV